MSKTPVQKGNTLYIPVFDGTSVGPPLSIKWQQDLAQHQEAYFKLDGTIEETGEPCNVFVAAEYYKTAAKNNPMHLSKIAQVEGGDYKITVDDRFQYGQKNAAGENRFIILHDKSRKPYQHRFIETTVAAALARQGAAAADSACATFGLPLGSASSITDAVKCYVGDYLHTF